MAEPLPVNLQLLHFIEKGGGMKGLVMEVRKKFLEILRKLERSV
jgi:hypothetical protein